jgi:hypothetical protein
MSGCVMSRATFSVVAMEGQISFSFEESVDLSFPTAWWYIGICDVSATRRTKHMRRSQDRAERGSLKAQKEGQRSREKRSPTACT